MIVTRMIASARSLPVIGVIASIAEVTIILKVPPRELSQTRFLNLPNLPVAASAGTNDGGDTEYRRRRRFALSINSRYVMRVETI